MDFITDLRYTIDKISETKDYRLLYKFLEKEGENINFLDKNTLRSCIFVILKYQFCLPLALAILSTSDFSMNRII